MDTVENINTKGITPPHDLEAERSVLGAILIDPEAIIKVADLINEDSFYLPAHQIIFKAMRELYEEGEPIDVITVTSKLRKTKSLKKVGGAAFIAKLSSSFALSSNIEAYAKLIKENFIKRRLISLSAKLSKIALDPSKDARDILDEAEQEVFGISQISSKKNFVKLNDILIDSFERIEKLQGNDSKLRGIPTGFQDLDNMLAGLQKSNLIILAARPGMGKTAFSLNIAQHVAVKEKKKVAFFSLEMSKEELVDRLLVAQADIDAWALKTGRLKEQDYMKLSDAMGVLSKAKLFIDDTPGLSIYDMRTRARRLMTEHGIDLLIVDYLQLAHGRNRDNRVLEVGEISQGLKNIARELKIPVLSLAQLSRAVESRGEKKPQLSDLRESGSIEQDADVVMFLYRKDEDIRESVTLKIAKHRNGTIGEIDLYFRGDRIRFYGMENRVI